MYSYGSPHMAAQKQDNQLERTLSSYVRIQDVVLKTYLGRWTIGRSGERGSGISVLPARYDDDDDSWIPNNKRCVDAIFMLSPSLRLLILRKTSPTFGHWLKCAAVLCFSCLPPDGRHCPPKKYSHTTHISFSDQNHHCPSVD